MFRLNLLKIKRHPVLGSFTLDFIKSNEISQESFVSVIIGRNGVGKSQILKAICEIFTYAFGVKNKDPHLVEPQYDFLLHYNINGRTYNISRESLEFAEPEDVPPLPDRVIASTSYVMDKFPTSSNDLYRYCGLRNENAPGQISTKGLVRKTVDWVMSSLASKHGFKDEIKDLLAHLDLLPRLSLYYSIRYKHMFLTGNMTPGRLKEIYQRQREYFPSRKHDIWGTSGFESIAKDQGKLQTISDFLNELHGRNIVSHLHYDLLDDHDNKIIYDAQSLILLQKIGILSYPSLTVYKSTDGFSFSESSSGENTLLCQFLSIMSNVEQNSLVLIDEPEQSCHPNWQINYIGWLRRIFSGYGGCHFIISTHSHFLLSDLDPKDSSLLILKKNNEGCLIDDGDEETPFCWSSDDILYRVFKVRNTRNSVFEGKMSELYGLLQNDGDKNQIMSLVRELKEYKLNDDDPLLRLLKMAESEHD